MLWELVHRFCSIFVKIFNDTFQDKKRGGGKSDFTKALFLDISSLK